ncbi:phosphatase PAP2 family protein [Streptomyces alboniger]|uniref:Phosphatase PAP2 family protein n=1 Tax=Streptomyces alboniger TaxID=132473 RepID=A0A5J6HUC7_STRAD|nr:phosphatase PAP2 family protein [Streptomyces alboniger]QEV22063.1 phosphatase PAP2 family protein [Streptomyces alboniger]
MTDRPVPAVLPPSLGARLGLTALLASLVAGVLGVLYAGHAEPDGVDRWISRPTADSVRPPWRGVALAVDFLAEPAGAAMLVVVAATGCLLLRRPRAAVLVVVGTGMTVGTTSLLKPLVGRTIHGEGNLSYPSGHTAFLTAFALVMALLAISQFRIGRTAGASLVLAASLGAGAAMGWAQVALGAHYPTDVLGGWCTALAVVPATAWLVDRVADRLGDRGAGPMVDAGRRERR